MSNPVETITKNHGGLKIEFNGDPDCHGFWVLVDPKALRSLKRDFRPTEAQKIASEFSEKIYEGMKLALQNLGTGEAMTIRKCGYDETEHRYEIDLDPIGWKEEYKARYLLQAPQIFDFAFNWAKEHYPAHIIIPDKPDYRAAYTPSRN